MKDDLVIEVIYLSRYTLKVSLVAEGTFFMKSPV